MIDLTSWSKTGKAFEYVVEVKKQHRSGTLLAQEDIIARDYNHLMEQLAEKEWELTRLVMVLDA